MECAVAGKENVAPQRGEARYINRGSARIVRGHFLRPGVPLHPRFVQYAGTKNVYPGSQCSVVGEAGLRTARVAGQRLQVRIALVISSEVQAQERLIRIIEMMVKTHGSQIRCGRKR